VLVDFNLDLPSGEKSQISLFCLDIFFMKKNSKGVRKLKNAFQVADLFVRKIFVEKVFIISTLQQFATGTPTILYKTFFFHISSEIRWFKI